MTRVLGERLLQALLVLLLVSATIFLAVEVLPGDPARRMLGREASVEAVAALHDKLGLNQPMLTRYGHWLAGAVQFDFGTSYASDRPVWDVIRPRLTVTAIVTAMALVAYVPLVLACAATQALRQDSVIDHMLSLVTMVFLSLPEFLLATALLLFLGLKLGWLPVHSALYPQMPVGEFITALIMPALTLAIIMATYAVRMLRDSLIDTLGADFVAMARFKGLSPSRIFFHHILPNALVPTLNVTALNISYLIGGVVIAERVFGLPGFGSLMVEALQLRDIAVIEASVLIASVVYVGANLAADLISLGLLPRFPA